MAEVKLILTADNSQYINKMKQAQTETQKVYDTAQKGGRQEKGILTEIEEKLTSLQKKRKDAFSYEEIAKYNKQIQETKLHLDEYEKAGMKAEKTGNSMVSSIGKWAAGLVTAAAAMKIFKSVIESTEGSMNKFEKIVGGATSGVNYFFKAIASGDWSNFSTNLKAAIKGAADYIDLMESLRNRQNELNIKSAEKDKQISDLRADTFDREEENNEKRKAALTEIIKLQKEKFDEEAKWAKDLYETNLRKAASDSGMDAKEIERFIRQYSSLEEMIKLGEKYNDLTKKIANEYLNKTPQNVRKLEEERDALGKNAKEAGAYYSQITKVIPQVRAELSGYLVTAIEKEAVFYATNRRDKMQLAALEAAEDKKATDEKSDNDKKANELRIERHRKAVELAIQEEEYLLEELKRLKAEAKKLFPETYITIFGTNAADDAVGGKAQKTYLERIQDMAKKAKETNKVIEEDNKKAAKNEDELRQQRIEALKQGLQTMQDFISKLVDKEVEMAQRRRELLDTRISELQNEIQTEAELQKQGYANNLSLKQKELAELKKTREKALRDEEEALRKQRALEAISQGINIFTTATQLLKTYTKIPLIGIALAAGAITAMFAILASVKSRSAESTKLAEGGSGSDTGVITGRTHARGGERFLSQVEVERGEAWGVLSVPATRKFGKVFHHMVSSFNKGEIPSVVPVNNINDISVDNSGSNSRLDQLIAENRKLNEKLSSDSIQTVGGIQIVRKGNTIRKIR